MTWVGLDAHENFCTYEHIHMGEKNPQACNKETLPNSLS